MKNVPPIKAETFFSSDYAVEPVDQHSNSANIFKQNDSSHDKINGIKVENFQPSNYMMESFHVDSNKVNFLQQTEVSFDEVNAKKISKKNVMLFNK